MKPLIAFGVAGLVLIAGAALAKYGTFEGQPEPFGYSSPDRPEDAWKSVNRDLYSTDADTSGIKGGKTYATYDKLRDGDWIDDFHGFGCEHDCHGQEAGYAWAKVHMISDPSDCGGGSWPFEEGCVAYATEKA